MRKHYDYPGAPTAEERRRLRIAKFFELVCCGVLTVATLAFLFVMFVYL